VADEARMKKEEMMTHVEFIEGGERTVVAAPTALQRPVWTGGHQGEVEAFARGQAERETVRRGQGAEAVLDPF
jgi:hypothetical protein